MERQKKMKKDRYWENTLLLVVKNKIKKDIEILQKAKKNDSQSKLW